MPDAQIIPFPERKKQRDEDEVFIQMSAGENVLVDWQNCSEHIHHFDSVPGTCRCGQHHWNPDLKITPA